MIRDVVRDCGYRVTGRFGSQKNGRMLGWESQLEKARFMRLEIDTDVISFEEQPLKIQYAFEQREHDYTPDILIKRHSSPRDTVEEIKSQYVLDSDPLSGSRFRAIEERCEELGYRFFLLTERDVLAEPQYSNACLIRGARHRQVPPALASLALTAAEAAGGVPLSDLEKAGLSQGQVLRLVFQGLLSFDLGRPFNRQTRLERRFA